MAAVEIRTAGPDDVNIIVALGITTCYEAYFELDPTRDLADYCVNFFDPEVIGREIADPGSTHLIAELDGRGVGFAKLREGKLIECMEGRHAIEIQRIYVLEKVKSRGVGRALIDSCFAAARRKGYQTVWLGVWDKNLPARRFYERIGMVAVGTTDFSDGKNEFVNLVYAIDL